MIELGTAITRLKKERDELLLLCGGESSVEGAKTWMAAKADLEALALQDLRRKVFMTGTWKCDTCGFEQNNRILNPSTGEVGVPLLEEIPTCPNKDGSKMRQVTWEECAASNYEAAQKFLDERDNLRKAFNDLIVEVPDWDDSPLPEDEQINATHPVVNGSHETYMQAMRLVGACRSKSRLTNLVNWLLQRGAEESLKIKELGEYLWPEQNGLPNKHRNPLIAVQTRERLLSERIAKLESYLDKTADGKLVCECEKLYCPECRGEVVVNPMVNYCYNCPNPDDGGYIPLPLSDGLCLSNPEAKIEPSK